MRSLGLRGFQGMPNVVSISFTFPFLSSRFFCEQVELEIFAHLQEQPNTWVDYDFDFRSEFSCSVIPLNLPSFTSSGSSSFQLRANWSSFNFSWPYFASGCTFPAEAWAAFTLSSSSSWSLSPSSLWPGQDQDPYRSSSSAVSLMWPKSDDRNKQQKSRTLHWVPPPLPQIGTDQWNGNAPVRSPHSVTAHRPIAPPPLHSLSGGWYRLTLPGPIELPTLLDPNSNSNG